MFKFGELESIHVEITNRCQASCPMCPRNIHGGVDNPTLKINDWSYSDFVNIITPTVLQQIKQINFCGSFGDPIMNNNLIAMCRYVKETNPHIRIDIHTNGSARTTSWWQELAAALPEQHSVEFALDGLADTHALYRVGTDWNKVIANAKTFIASGGTAIWMYIRFRHNEHQIEEAELLANELGFDRFKLKDTRRFETEKFTVLDRAGQVSHYLEQPSNSPIRFVDRRSLETYSSWPKKQDIDCFALNHSEIYIDACYTVMPCCMLAAFIYTNYDREILEKNGLHHEYSYVDFGAQIQQQVFDIIEELGGLDKLNACDNSIQNIIDDEVWQTIWQQKWQAAESIGCIALCSASSPYIKLEEQWVNDV
jgi:hypothetical protein